MVISRVYSLGFLAFGLANNDVGASNPSLPPPFLFILFLPFILSLSLVRSGFTQLCVTFR